MVRRRDLIAEVHPVLQALVALGVIAVVGSFALINFGCGEEVFEPEGLIVSVGPHPVLPRSQLVIVAKGRPELLNTIEGFDLSGELAGELIEETSALRVLWRDVAAPEEASETVAWISETPSEWRVASGVEERFVGELGLLRRDGEVLWREPLELVFRQTLEPRLRAAPVFETWWGESSLLEIQQGLLGHEGETSLLLDGEFRSEGQARDESVHGLAIPCRRSENSKESDRLGGAEVSAGKYGRDGCIVTIGPSTFPGGVGWFRGTMRIVNVHADGAVLESASGRGAIKVLPPEVSLQDLTVARGRWIKAQGRGLWVGPFGVVGAEREKGSSDYTRLRLEGLFTPSRGAVQTFLGHDAVHLRPEVGSTGQLMRVVLRPESDLVSGLYGLGSTPGWFEGEFATITTSSHGETFVVHGGHAAFKVVSPTQVVVLRFLPEFENALRRFGLEVERQAVISRVFEVVKRDFREFAVSVVDSPPDAFADYMVVEIKGDDPNGLGLLGLDNSPDKDVGNIRLDEVLGGEANEVEGRALSGGVFVSELMQFSPRIGGGPLVSERFDEIFAPISPELGGRPVEAGEAQHESRQRLIETAVHVLGSLVGSTITHEVGHALGLTAISGRIHNEGDTPLAIMDEGVARPFEERAELEGWGPAVWEPHNRLYLESILSLEP